MIVHANDRRVSSNALHALRMTCATSTGLLRVGVHANLCLFLLVVIGLSSTAHSKHLTAGAAVERVSRLHHHSLHGHRATATLALPSSNRTHRSSSLPHHHTRRVAGRRVESATRASKQSQSSLEQSSGHSENISHLLDQLLLGYDNHVRPNFGGPPIEVLIDFHIRSMGPVSEIDMTYVIDCYFRQMWTDHRLAYKMPILQHTLANAKGDSYNPNAQAPNSPNSSDYALALSIYMLDRIWKPPTYFLNSRQSHMHMITLPNKFVRIYSNGQVLYSSRMTIKANCLMNLANFPMDTQRCPLTLGSFGYTSKDLIYTWNPKRKVVINPDMKMSQFDLISVPVHSDNSTMRTASIQQSFSVLVATFHFKRHMGSFVIEVYAPCIMLVVLSWVGFWINREATADRVTLGLTTVLTMTFLGLELRNDLPKVPYLTALDYFVYISFAFISATILEFGFVHFFTKIGSGEFYFMPIQDMSREEDDDDDQQVARGRRSIISQRLDPGHMSRSADSIIHRASSGADVKRSASWSMAERDAVRTPQLARHSLGNGRPLRRTIQVEYHPVVADNVMNQSRFSALRTSFRNRLRHSFRQRGRRSCIAIDHGAVSGRPVQETSVRVQLNSVSQIDRTSRVIFPLAFLGMNFIYWFVYLRAESNIDKHQLKLTTAA